MRFRSLWVVRCKLPQPEEMSEDVKKKETPRRDLGGRYAPPRVIAVDKFTLEGNPDLSKATTSHIERQNLTLRTFQRRLTRFNPWFLEKAWEPESGSCLALHVLQFLLDSKDTEGHASNGSGYHGSCLEHRRTGPGMVSINRQVIYKALIQDYRTKSVSPDFFQ